MKSLVASWLIGGSVVGGGDVGVRGGGFLSQFSPSHLWRLCFAVAKVNLEC